MLNIQNIGKRLRVVREFFKFTQQRMAEILNIRDVTYKKNERGEHLVKVNTLDRLHDELGVSAEWLLFENGPIFWKDIKEKSVEKKEEGQSKKDLYQEEVEEMVKVLELVPIIRHLVMGRFQECKIQYKDLIAEALESKK